MTTWLKWSTHQTNQRWLKLLQTLSLKAFEVAGDQEHKQVPVTEGQFEFVLKDENNKVVETAKNQADGTVNFEVSNLQ